MSGSEKPDLSGALAVGRKLDLILPDSRAVRDAYAEAEAESQPWLFNHVMRSWLYGAKLAQRRGLAPDAELVAVAVLLHDVSLARGMIWASAVQRQFGTRSRSTPPRRLRSIRARTWPAVRTASPVTTADSVIVS